MHQQPTMQPVMESFLANKLTGFFTNLFKVSQRCFCGDGQKRSQAGKRTTSPVGIPKAQAATIRIFQE